MFHGREPESETAISSHITQKDIRSLRKLFLTSQEFAMVNSDFLARIPCLVNFRPEWSDMTSKFYREVALADISLSQISDLYCDAGISDAYATLHLRRFHELFSFLASRFRGKSINMLEIGIGAHTLPYYKKYLNCESHSVCRPVSIGGPDQEWAHHHGSSRHWEVDLNHPENYPIDDIPNRHYDLVVCCEVAEHLTRAPRDLIRMALAKLKPSGLLFLSTPNFLTPAKISLVFGGKNPTSDFLEYNNNYHAHQHFREYTPCELVKEIEAGGGSTELVVFSNCWDENLYSTPDEAMYRSNLVMIINPTSL